MVISFTYMVRNYISKPATGFCGQFFLQQISQMNAEATN